MRYANKPLFDVSFDHIYKHQFFYIIYITFFYNLMDGRHENRYLMLGGGGRGPNVTC